MGNCSKKALSKHANEDFTQMNFDLQQDFEFSVQVGNFSTKNLSVSSAQLAIKFGNLEEMLSDRLMDTKNSTVD